MIVSRFRLLLDFVSFVTSLARSLLYFSAIRLFCFVLSIDGKCLTRHLASFPLPLIPLIGKHRDQILYNESQHWHVTPLQTHGNAMLAKLRRKILGWLVRIKFIGNLSRQCEQSQQPPSVSVGLIDLDCLARGRHEGSPGACANLGSKNATPSA